MKKATFGRLLALVTVFAMVFASAMMFSAPRLQAAPTGDVLRVELNQTWGSIGTNTVTGMTAGNEYTMSFWFMNTGANDEISVQGTADPWPDLHEAPSQPDAWVYHEFKFTIPSGQTRVQVANPYPRVVGDVFYVSAVTITGTDGTNVTFNPADGFQVSGSVTSVVAPPAGPSIGGPSAGGGGGRTRIPLTGDDFNPVWIAVSGLGLAASLAALFVVYKKKK
jgi:LPXTG-motif cell wall-anchored protein